MNEVEKEYTFWYGHAMQLAAQGNYNEAVKDFNRALQIKPDSHEAWWNRGNTLCFLEEYTEAIFSYDKALKINPNKEFSWQNPR
ncbi:MAG: tetratricopeptide repeat protein [Prochloraceae cyanobacterium]